MGLRQWILAMHRQFDQSPKAFASLTRRVDQKLAAQHHGTGPDNVHCIVTSSPKSACDILQI